MISLVSGFWKWLTLKNELRFLIVGLDNAGKTTTLELIKELFSSKNPRLPPEAIGPTIGLNLCHVTFDLWWTGVFWDLGGQLLLRSIWEHHYGQADGLLFVIDSTDPCRFPEVRATVSKVIQHEVLRRRQIPVAIFANKQDDQEHARPLAEIVEALALPRDCLERARVVPVQSAERLFSESQRPARQSVPDLELSSTPPSELGVFPLPLVCLGGGSAKNGVNVKEVITVLVDAAKQRRQTLPVENNKK